MSELSVLDASAVIALINDEPGAGVVRNVVFTSVISTVTLAEIESKLSEWHGRGTAVAEQVLFALSSIVPFTQAQARTAGKLRSLTREAGLSLGDRACLALAIDHKLDVYTADKSWAALPLPCQVRLVR